ncbi:MAG TPA: hypothetical protein VK845_06070, partial [Gemmatimonadales bacterium]|nr:hypothetical protein [Gemmatimonadales bacterium]
EVFITIRDLTQAGDCFDSALVAEGWGQFLHTDNDIYGVGPDDKNANSWGFQGHGQLTAPDGSTVMYNGHLRLTYNNSVGLRGTAMVNVH